jgi:hypothetical protein
MFDTVLSLRDLARYANEFFLREKATVHQIQTIENPLDAFDDQPDLAVSAIKKGGYAGRKHSAVQLYVAELGDHRGVMVAAPGQSAGERLWLGSANTFSIKYSAQRAQPLVEAFRQHDSSIPAFPNM